MEIVNTTKGKIKGIQKEHYTLFAGVPYAKAPIGDLRWRAPEEMAPWQEVYEATTFPNSCLQNPPHTAFYQKEFASDLQYQVTNSEDCLYLNIWTPNKRSESPLPVAFWIHGGAFMGGHCSEVAFDGQAYCQRGVILVTINYRLNIFGFLAHEELAQESEHNVSGNYGILDQIAALKWVYENISAFNGDPHKITIFGQSAGSMSVQTLVSSELTHNMIDKAILQSGGGYSNGLSKDRSHESAMSLGKEVLEVAKVESIKGLRKLSSREIHEIGNQAMDRLRGREGLIFIPNIDGFLLKDGYNALIDQGHLKNIPYLLGATKNDMFTNEAQLKKGDRGPLLKGCVDLALKLEEQGKKRAYVYHFTRDLPGDASGAFHSSELWYMFGTLDRSWRPWEEKDYQLSSEMLDYWCNFIKYANPCETKEDKWPACTAATGYVKELG